MKSNDVQANPTTDPDRLMNEKEAAEVLCYSVRALQNWRSRGGGPKFIKVSARSVRYRRRDLLDWIDAHTVTSTSQPI
ncbi:helix-turn-helix domain-containing protein [uncultured Roseovarius sp.]|uniref:helix-turn-helix transcriptional regulator n=1 Tax=uncultured Roseovarius sp. TaxID=293344 RepID=UPI0025DA36D6|nr:helix-turn-helix domain-containing protein [uncultured Roseovarius sp.]